MDRGWTIISGGQAGVDRAALDAARALGLPYGGFVPRGRRTVVLADATLIVTRGLPDQGTLLTLRIAEAKAKPVLCIDLAAIDADEGVQQLVDWLSTRLPGVLNVAGPRESRQPGIYDQARALLFNALAALPPGRPAQS